MQDDPNNVDTLIDDVAREITGARAGDDNQEFARRVSARIHDEDAARTPRIRRRTWLLAPAAAVVLVLAVLLVRQMRWPDATTQTASGLGTKAASGLRAAGSGLGEIQSSAVGPQPSAGGPQPSALGPQPAALSVQPLLARVLHTAAGRRPALPPAGWSGDPDLRPLTTAPIETAALDVSPLVVAMPIEISTIAVERIEMAAMP